MPESPAIPDQHRANFPKQNNPPGLNRTAHKKTPAGLAKRGS
jgi:hypothetical protein